MKFQKILKNKLYIGIGIVVIIGLIWLGSTVFKKGIAIGVSNGNGTSGPVSSIAGLPCESASRRPFAVMLGADPEARPLSGIGQADLVVEMPVTPDGITRYMAVYQCQTPKEIGSIRSARQDFIPLAAGFNTIYAHWGGEHGALDTLNQHVMDNINALLFDGTIFYRKKSVAPPYNGFTTIDLLTQQAQKYNYSLTEDAPAYLHNDTMPARNISNIANTISIPYTGASGAVNWTYDQDHNVYDRTRAGTPEIDANTTQQVTASVVIVMHTTSHILRQGDQYIVVNTTGSGDADIYQNGVLISGHWTKDPAQLNSKLVFTDAANKEIQFVSGQIWIQIVTS